MRAIAPLKLKLEVIARSEASKGHVNETVELITLSGLRKGTAVNCLPPLLMATAGGNLCLAFRN